MVAEDRGVADLDGFFEVDGVLEDDLELFRKRKTFFVKTFDGKNKLIFNIKQHSHFAYQ